jgi:putative addiction module component (TIGR02574 family)
MTASIQHIEIQVLSLPRDERTRLAINLLESIEERPNMDPRQVELAWLDEANRRFQAYQAGEEQAISADEVFADLRADDR